MVLQIWCFTIIFPIKVAIFSYPLFSDKTLFHFSASRCDGIGVDHDSAALVDLQIAGIYGWLSPAKYAIPGYPPQFIAMENGKMMSQQILQHLFL